MSIEELKSLQDKIIQKNKTINIIFAIIISIVVGITLFIVLSTKAEIQFIIISMFVELVVLIIILVITKGIVNGNDIQTFNKEFKNIFVLKSLKNYFDDLVYKPEKGFSEEEIDKIGMLDTGDRFDSNDYISGKYKNINFEQSDIHVEEKHEEEDEDGKKKEVWETIFRGRWMIFDFNKRFKSNVQVVSSGFPAHSLPLGKKFSRVKMEDVEFNKMFFIYSETEHEAFYILTPHFMEKLKKVYRELKCSIMFGFVDNRLYVAINNYEDSFEYNVFKKINEEEIEKNIIKDIKVITDFVNELDLDNDLFRKEV